MDDNKIINKNNSKEIEVKTDYHDIVFSNDSFGQFIFKRTEKISSAIYLLTSLLSDKEPMKWSLRHLANRSINETIHLSNRVWGQIDYFSEIISSYSEILSIFNMANIAGIISPMNYEIITAEIDKILKLLIQARNGEISDIPAFPANYFSKEEYIQDSRNYYTNSQHPTYKGQKDIKDSNVLYKNNKENIGHTHNTPKDKNNRQEKILSLLTGGKVLTIKDFSSEIKDCSEKTIQRELLALVAKNVLKKEGERRWSKYSLI